MLAWLVTAELPAWHALDAPDTATGPTVADVKGAEDPVDHRRLVLAWAEEVWTA